MTATTNRKDTSTWLLELLVRWGGTKADPESGPGSSQPLSPPALLSQWRAPAEEGPQPFNIFHFCVSPLYIAPKYKHECFIKSCSSSRRKATPAHTSSTDIPHRSAFYLSPQHKSSKYKAKPRRLSPCVTDWRQRVARWSIYFQLTGASTIHLQTSWHKWYFLQAAPTCATVPARLSQEESA